jgi:hypothetical protein
VFANKAKVINFLLQKLESWAFCGFNQPLAFKTQLQKLEKNGHSAFSSNHSLCLMHDT